MALSAAVEMVRLVELSISSDEAADERAEDILLMRDSDDMAVIRRRTLRFVTESEWFQLLGL